MRKVRVMLSVVAVLAGACGSSDGPEPAAPSSAGEEPVSELVGTWERETTCTELVSVLTAAGLEDWVLDAVAGNGFIPGVKSSDQIANPDEPCDGAVPRTHAHFFTEDGQFGSLDWTGEQVDDGTYVVTDGDTFVISKEFPDVTFHFTVDADTISLEPVIPTCTPKCFEAAWSVLVAYPGMPWHRVDSSAR